MVRARFVLPAPAHPPTGRNHPVRAAQDPVRERPENGMPDLPRRPAANARSRSAARDRCLRLALGRVRTGRKQPRHALAALDQQRRVQEHPRGGTQEHPRQPAVRAFSTKAARDRPVLPEPEIVLTGRSRPHRAATAMPRPGAHQGQAHPGRAHPENGPRERPRRPAERAPLTKSPGASVRGQIVLTSLLASRAGKIRAARIAARDRVSVLPDRVANANRSGKALTSGARESRKRKATPNGVKAKAQDHALIKANAPGIHGAPARRGLNLVRPSPGRTAGKESHESL